MKKWAHIDNHIRYNFVDSTVFPDLKSLLRCLAHIINLATQAILKAHSKSEHYDAKDPSAHEPDVDALFRDEIRLVRAVIVKVW